MITNCGRLTSWALSNAASIPAMKQKLTIGKSRCPELKINAQRLVPGNPFGGWLRRPSMRHIAYCSYVPTATSRFRNERNPIVHHAILIGDQHASLPSWFVFFSLPHPPFFLFFFPSSGAPKGAPLQSTERVFFLGGGSGERVILGVADHSPKPSECLTLFS